MSLPWKKRLGGNLPLSTMIVASMLFRRLLARISLECIISGLTGITKFASQVIVQKTTWCQLPLAEVGLARHCAPPQSCVKNSSDLEPTKHPQLPNQLHISGRRLEPPGMKGATIRAHLPWPIRKCQGLNPIEVLDVSSSQSAR